ncbi:MAG: hypothetical protein MNPFHGCM_00039 [Gemmatimonadaceae bacterium]|nr:hypothetical protein [Gemmatimonadaceae bacterium]
MPGSGMLWRVWPRCFDGHHHLRRGLVIADSRICRHFILCTLLSGVATAQAPLDSAGRVRWRDFPSRHPRIVTSTGVAAATAAVSFFDSHLAYETRKLRDRSGERMQRVSSQTSSIGGFLPLAIGGTLAAAGWASNHEFTRTLGVDAVRSVVTAGLLTSLIKGGVGRVRPRALVNDIEAYQPGKGFFNNDFASFPSGHTSSAFAAATVLAAGLSKAQPRHSRWIRLGLYGAAAAVGLSRMYENAHWASDVFAGAAIGTLSGMHVVRQRAVAHP